MRLCREISDDVKGMYVHGSGLRARFEREIQWQQLEILSEALDQAFKDNAKDSSTERLNNLKLIGRLGAAFNDPFFFLWVSKQWQVIFDKSIDSITPDVLKSLQQLLSGFDEVKKDLSWGIAVENISNLLKLKEAATPNETTSAMQKLWSILIQNMPIALLQKMSRLLCRNIYFINDLTNFSDNKNKEKILDVIKHAATIPNDNTWESCMGLLYAVLMIGELSKRFSTNKKYAYQDYFSTLRVKIAHICDYTKRANVFLDTVNGTTRDKKTDHLATLLTEIKTMMALYKSELQDETENIWHVLYLYKKSLNDKIYDATSLLRLQRKDHLSIYLANHTDATQAQTLATQLFSQIESIQEKNLAAASGNLTQKNLLEDAVSSFNKTYHKIKNKIHAGDKSPVPSSVNEIQFFFESYESSLNTIFTPNGNFYDDFTRHNKNMKQSFSDILQVTKQSIAMPNDSISVLQFKNNITTFINAFLARKYLNSNYEVSEKDMKLVLSRKESYVCSTTPDELENIFEELFSESGKFLNKFKNYLSAIELKLVTKLEQIRTFFNVIKPIMKPVISNEVRHKQKNGTFFTKIVIDRPVKNEHLVKASEWFAIHADGSITLSKNNILIIIDEVCTEYMKELEKEISQSEQALHEAINVLTIDPSDAGQHTRFASLKSAAKVTLQGTEKNLKKWMTYVAHQKLEINPKKEMSTYIIKEHLRLIVRLITLFTTPMTANAEDTEIHSYKQFYASLFVITAIGQSIRALYIDDADQTIHKHVNADLAFEFEFIRWLRGSLAHVAENIANVEEQGFSLAYYADDLLSIPMYSDEAHETYHATHGLKAYLLEVSENITKTIDAIDNHQLHRPAIVLRKLYQKMYQNQLYKAIQNEDEKMEKLVCAYAKSFMLIGRPKNRDQVNHLLSVKDALILSDFWPHLEGVQSLNQQHDITFIGVFGKLERFGHVRHGEYSGLFIEMQNDRDTIRLKAYKQKLQKLIGFRLKVINRIQLQAYCRYQHPDRPALAEELYKHIREKCSLQQLKESYDVHEALDEALRYDDYQNLLDMLNNAKLHFELTIAYYHHYTGDVAPGNGPILHRMIQEYGIALHAKMRQNSHQNQSQWVAQQAVAVHSLYRGIMICLQQGADINAVDIYGNTPLMMALNHTCIRLARQLIQYPEIDFFRANTDGKTALHIAAEFDAVSHIALIAKLIPPFHDFRSVYKNIIHQCITYKNIELMSMLLELGYDVDSLNDIGRSSLHDAVLAIERKWKSALKAANKVDVDSDGEEDDNESHTERQYATDVTFHERCIEKLLAYNAKVYATSGVNPLCMMVKCGYARLALLMLNARNFDSSMLDLNDQGSDCGSRPIHFALEQYYKKRTYDGRLLVETLIQKGCKINEKGSHRRPLQFTIYNKDTAMTELLLRYQANIEHSRFLEDALSDDHEAAELLIRYGAITDDIDFSETISPDFSRFMEVYRHLKTALSQGNVENFKDAFGQLNQSKPLQLRFRHIKIKNGRVYSLIDWVAHDYCSVIRRPNLSGHSEIFSYLLDNGYRADMKDLFIYKPTCAMDMFIVLYREDRINWADDQNLDNLFWAKITQHAMKTNRQDVLDTLQKKHKLCLMMEDVKSNGSMTNRVGKRNKGYVRHEVEADGNCGYTSFGITRESAVQLLLRHIADIANIIKLPVQHALLTEDFHRYLFDNGIVTTSHQTILNDDSLLDRYSTDLAVQYAYIQYDVEDKCIDAGYSHPAVLQALAHIQNIEIHMWRLGENNILVPHNTSEGNYAVYAPQGNNERVDILFINNNHFERLELSSYEGNIPENGIYPLETSWSQSNFDFNELYTPYYDVLQAVIQNDVEKFKQVTSGPCLGIYHNVFEGDSVLHLAVKYSAINIAEYLFSSNLVLDTDELGCDETTVLHSAYVMGNEDMIVLLQKHGANPNYIYASGRTILEDIIDTYTNDQESLLEIVTLVLKTKDLLINHGVSRSILCQAVSRNNVPLVQLLCGYSGIDIDSPSYDSPLDIAIDNYYYEMIKALVKAGVLVYPYLEVLVIYALKEGDMEFLQTILIRSGGAYQEELQYQVGIIARDTFTVADYNFIESELNKKEVRSMICGSMVNNILSCITQLKAKKLTSTPMSFKSRHGMLHCDDEMYPLSTAQHLSIWDTTPSSSPNSCPFGKPA